VIRSLSISWKICTLGLLKSESTLSDGACESIVDHDDFDIDLLSEGEMKGTSFIQLLAVLNFDLHHEIISWHHSSYPPESTP